MRSPEQRRDAPDPERQALTPASSVTDPLRPGLELTDTLARQGILLEDVTQEDADRYDMLAAENALYQRSEAEQKACDRIAELVGLEAVDPAELERQQRKIEDPEPGADLPLEVVNPEALDRED